MQQFLSTELYITVIHMVNDVCFLFVFFAAKVHAILPTTGLLECGDVRHVRAAETGSDGGEPQIYKHPTVMICCQTFGLHQAPCFHSTTALAVRLAPTVKLQKKKSSEMCLFYGTNVSRKVINRNKTCLMSSAFYYWLELV